MAEDIRSAADRLEKQWRGMVRISHDFYLAWLQAVTERLGAKEAAAAALRFWEIIGAGSARAYRQSGWVEGEDLGAVVQAMARSSEVMGETVETSGDGEAFYLIHRACPWMQSYARAGLAGQCQEGCDRWFTSTVAAISPRFRVETLQALPAGDDCCRRRFWVED